MSNAVVRGPVSGGNGQATALLAPVEGYQEDEYFYSGSACRWIADDEQSDGHVTARSGSTAPFTSRLIVRRPVDVASASGVVLVEWLNVTAGVDGAPDWTFGRDEIIRSRHTWVGVSAQQVGISGGSAAIAEAAAIAGPGGGGLVGTDPDRYGTLTHPGDVYSFDIFDHAGRAVRSGDILGGMSPTHVIAVGESQSATFLATYVNAVHPQVSTFDGFLLHSRLGSAPTLDGAALDPTGEAPPARIRTDLDVPVLQFVTETDLTLLRFAPARQPDTDRIVTWEVAGTAHADRWLIGQSLGGIDVEPADLLGCPGPANNGPHHEVFTAALHHLVDWVVAGTMPPTGTAIETVTNADGTLAISRDAAGIAIGGIRTPAVDVPRSALSGDAAPGGSMLCALFGSTRLFDTDELADRYPSDATYLEQFRSSLHQATSAGYVLPPEADAWEAAVLEQFGGSS